MSIAQVSEQLIVDHVALDDVLKQLQSALRGSDIETAYAKLDLFWARLAVHIRAEHLHLFPAVVNALGDEAQEIVTELREDHEFFMHELARAVEIARKLITVSEQPLLNEGLKNIENIIVQIEARLVKHNQVEENQVYGWATTVLSPEDQATLMEGITKELRNRPSRFTENTWSQAG